MEKFSVIIPTIWKGEDINELLTRYYNCEAVHEVILINNNRLNTPDFPRHKKLLYVEPDENIFVNPAWNLGVRMARCSNVVISNDDILYNVNLLFSVLYNMETEFKKLDELGIIGMSHDNYLLEKDDEDIRLQYHQRKPAWGCLLIFNKKNYTNIPEQLKIFYGDNFLQSAFGRIFDLVGISIKSKISSSADTQVKWVKDVIDNDTIEWQKIIKNQYDKNGHN